MQEIVRYIQSSCDIELLTDHWLGRYQTQVGLFVTLLSGVPGPQCLPGDVNAAWPRWLSCWTLTSDVMFPIQTRDGGQHLD